MWASAAAFLWSSERARRAGANRTACHGPFLREVRFATIVISTAERTCRSAARAFPRAAARRAASRKARRLGRRATEQARVGCYGELGGSPRWNCSRHAKLATRPQCRDTLLLITALENST